jgi:hypothetical protein
MKSEKEIREKYEKIKNSYEENEKKGSYRHGAWGEVTGIGSRQLGNLESLEWVLKDEDNNKDSLNNALRFVLKDEIKYDED